MPMRIPKSISARVEEWSLIEDAARAVNMNRSEYLVACAMSSIKASTTYDSVGAEVSQKLEFIESTLASLKETLSLAKQTIDTHTSIEDAYQAKQEEIKKQKENDQMLRPVKPVLSKPTPPIEPQMYKPSHEELIDYLKHHKDCTVEECASHFNSRPAYIKMQFGIMTEQNAVRVEMSGNVQIYNLAEVC